MFDYLDLFVTCVACNNDYLASNLGDPILCGMCLSHEQEHTNYQPGE